MPDDRPDVPPPGGTVPAETPAVAEPTEDWASRFKYLLADFENYRRRSERERESISRQCRGAMLRELLPILEAFRSARESIDRLSASDPLRRGLDLVDREWTTFLKHEGVEPVVRVGEPFRAEEAEAVGDAPARHDLPDGAVAEIVQQGYRFYGGLLRPAKVVVARAPSAARPKATPEPAAEAPSEERP
jgi:molecular chaperone GrpE